MRPARWWWGVHRWLWQELGLVLLLHRLMLLLCYQEKKQQQQQLHRVLLFHRLVLLVLLLYHQKKQQQQQLRPVLFFHRLVLLLLVLLYHQKKQQQQQQQLRPVLLFHRLVLLVLLLVLHQKLRLALDCLLQHQALYSPLGRPMWVCQGLSSTIHSAPFQPVLLTQYPAPGRLASQECWPVVLGHSIAPDLRHLLCSNQAVQPFLKSHRMQFGQRNLLACVAFLRSAQSVI